MVHPSFCFTVHVQSTYLVHFDMYITDIKVNDGHKSDILNFIKLTFSRAYPYMKPHIVFDSSDLAI